MTVAPLGQGNSGPGGQLDRPPQIPDVPLVVALQELDFRVATLQHGVIVERRVELYRKGDEQPLISLTADDARGAGYVLKRLADQADRG